MVQLDSRQQSSAVADEQGMTELRTVKKTHAEEAIEEKAFSSAGDTEEPVDIDDQSPVEQVALTVPTTDDPSLQVWTFRMWFLGLTSCAVLSFLNQFFSYRREPLIVSLLTVQIAALPIGRFMAATLPTTKFKVPLTNWRCSLNPGPFNVKEHVLVTIFANAGTAFSSGNAYAVGIITITKAFYKRNIGLIPSILLVVTTQVLGYGWAGMMRGYLVNSAYMWWPANMVQVSLFRTLHEDEKLKSKGSLTRNQFFLIFMIVSFSYYLLPGYLFGMLTSLSWVCWAWPNSVTAQQLGSGLYGLGLGAFAVDWSTISAFLLSPLVSPFFATVNIFVGFVLVCYVITPATYWSNVYNAKSFPIFSEDLFTSTGQPYNISAIVNNNFEVDLKAYEAQGRINLSTFFAMTYGFGFATVAATVSHVLCFNGKQIWRQSRAALKEKPDVHARLMQRYPDIPHWWFLILDGITIGVSIAICEGWKKELQLPWWGVLFACVLACFFTMPIGVITATTNQTPGLNIITEYIMGYLLPGRPIANVCFKTYGYISMSQAVSFLSDFKLGHYMKVPPRSMFIVQIVGTILAAVVNVGVAWWLLTSIHNICDPALLPASSPWTCPGDRVFYDASIIWGLVGPKRVWGSMGEYSALNWFFLAGFMAPILVWLLHKAFPRVKWIPLINMPVLLGSTANMPPATPVNYTSWIIVGTIFNFFIFRYRKSWWQRYNYVLSAAMDSGLAFMAVLLYFTLGLENKSINWWGTNVDNCPLATCPTQPGIQVDGCPVY